MNVSILDFNHVQNVEYITRGPIQYLLVHKSACSTIRNSIGQFETLVRPRPGGYVWTCFRDPIKRFKAGLFYDIKNSGLLELYEGKEVELFKKILSQKETFDCYGKISIDHRSSGRIPHTYPQVSYWYNQPIDLFVDINDITSFLNLHYDQCVDSNITDKNLVYELFMDVISKYDDKIKDIHLFDYYFLDKMAKDNKIWQWEYGRMF